VLPGKRADKPDDLLALFVLNIEESFFTGTVKNVD
jgi:hypothetical protein